MKFGGLLVFVFALPIISLQSDASNYTHSMSLSLSNFILFSLSGKH